MFDVNLKTPHGTFLLTVSKKGLFGLRFPGTFAPEREPQTEIKSRQMVRLISQTRQSLIEYLKGHPASFRKLKVDWTGMTPFEKTVLKKLFKTEYGTSFSYGELARQVKRPKAARAVGTVLRKNRLPVIVPCHRVLAGDGRLGGFSAGIVWKQRLLALEADNPHGV